MLNYFRIFRKGISPILATMLIILMTTVGVTLALTIVLPAINRAQESSVINEGMENMKIMDNVIREVASEGTGTFRTVQLKVSGGEYKINGKSNNIEFTYPTTSGIFTADSYMKEGNLILSAGANAKASEYDLNNDGTTELVLENEILRVGIVRNGTSTSYATMNTSGIIKLINIKDNSMNVTPVDSSIVLDDIPSTSYGNGYSELVRSGDNLPKAEVLVHVNTTYAVYDVIYTLQSGTDFLIIKIQNAYYR